MQLLNNSTENLTTYYGYKNVDEFFDYGERSVSTRIGTVALLIILKIADGLELVGRFVWAKLCVLSFMVRMDNKAWLAQVKGEYAKLFQSIKNILNLAPMGRALTAESWLPALRMDGQHSEGAHTFLIYEMSKEPTPPSTYIFAQPKRPVGLGEVAVWTKSGKVLEKETIKKVEELFYKCYWDLIATQTRSIPYALRQIDADIEVSYLPFAQRVTKTYTGPKDDDVIADGYGDFIVHKADGSDVSFETYQKVDALFQKYHPAKGIEGRSAKIKADLPEGLGITFIPRTLYELFFIRKCSESSDDPMTNEWVKLEEGHEKYQKMAHKLNGALIAGLAGRTALTYGQIKALYNEQYEALYNLNGTYDSNSDVRCNAPCPHHHFLGKYGRGKMRPMTLADQDNEVEARIHRVLDSALALECSTDVVDKAVLYRGGHMIEFPAGTAREDDAFSVSYGSSIFAGVVNDPGATAFTFMRSSSDFSYGRGGDRFATALIVDPIKDSELFYIPPTSTMHSLFGEGEWFHPRSKVFQKVGEGKIAGYVTSSAISYEEAPKEIVSSLERNTFGPQFMKKTEQVINLAEAIS